MNAFKVRLVCEILNCVTRSSMGWLDDIAFTKVLYLSMGLFTEVELIIVTTFWKACNLTRGNLALVIYTMVANFK